MIQTYDSIKVLINGDGSPDWQSLFSVLHFELFHPSHIKRMRKQTRHTIKFNHSIPGWHIRELDYTIKSDIRIIIKIVRKLGYKFYDWSNTKQRIIIIKGHYNYGSIIIFDEDYKKK